MIDGGGVAGSKAEAAFRIAADFWGRMLTNNATVNITINFVRLTGGTMGNTAGRSAVFSVRAWETAVRRTKSRSAIDGVIVLPRLNGGAITGLTLGTNASGQNDVTVTTRFTHRQRSGRFLLLNSSVAKALGMPLDHPDRADAEITLNSGFAFDADPTDGVTPSGVDLVAVAIHEMGHALGFGSGVADVDQVTAPNGPERGKSATDYNARARFGALDMFRYGASGMIDLRPGADTFFSIDGGRSALLSARFASGAFNGDHDQAGHFKNIVGRCTMSFGIMDAARCGGQMGVVTGTDLATFDAIGWNLSVDALRVTSLTTNDIVREYRARNAPGRVTMAVPRR